MPAERDDSLVTSNDPDHPANLIPELCRKFYQLGWVTGELVILVLYSFLTSKGTGGGASIRQDRHIYIAPSGVQKELIQPKDIFVLEYPSRRYVREPSNLKPSACTPLFLTAFDTGAGCSIHTHSRWAVLVTLLVEQMYGRDACFEISNIEQIKAIPRGGTKPGMLNFDDTLRIPIIENTRVEEDLTDHLQIAMAAFPNTYAVLVRRHGM
jgi:methylthioribulose-1-phosphate dehydratase